MNRTRRLMLGAAAAIPLLGMERAFSQQYPSKPIRIIIPASAGTSIDVTARYISEPLSKRLNTPVLVEDRPGAGGLLAYAAAARASPDGYTLVLAGIPMYLLPLLSETPASFDPQKDFVPVARVARLPLAVVVPADSPYRTLSDLIRAMKSKPGEVTYSSQGVGSTAHLCGVVLNDMSKTSAQHVASKETTTAITDVAGGRIAFTCQGSAGVLPMIKAGKLRALAVTGTKRWKVLPDIPTVAEAGIQGFELSSWLDFMAPAGTPAPVLQVLSDEISRIAQTAAFNEFCERQVIFPEVLGYKSLMADMHNEAARWKRIVQLARGS
ncbi:Bug family tripartite tricarboxylate transporter substrate binding protein [Cupriavidus sp. CuC1]|uniref:Bug family tripartite tricarboxylate transporter substrate binding protein n=1 Tax=Cupriavidus sp. CuC1 TaxID=3373131 RepID=UPI0037D08D11